MNDQQHIIDTVVVAGGRMDVDVHGIPAQANPLGVIVEGGSVHVTGIPLPPDSLTVKVNGGALDVHLDSLPEFPDPLNVLVQPDTLLVDVVTKDGVDPLFGWSWDAWQGTGQWFGPVLVFGLTLLFGWIGKQWQLLRRQSAHVAHFVHWRSRILDNITRQRTGLFEYAQSVNVMEHGNMPTDPLIRIDLQLRLWLELRPSQMTHVFVINKQGSVEELTTDVQELLVASRAIESNLNLARQVLDTLAKETEVFKSEWAERVRIVSDLLIAIMEGRNQSIQGADITAFKRLIDKHSFFTGSLTARRLGIEGLLKDLIDVYSQMQQPAFTELGAALLLLQRSINQIESTEKRAKELMTAYLREVGLQLLTLADKSARIAHAKDKFFMALL